MKSGIDAFARGHNGKNPTDIIIFRDGVSAGERQQVIDAEVGQFK